MVRFNCNAFDGKHPFWVNLVQKPKLFFLRKNLTPRLIRIRWIWQFCAGNTLFAQFGPKNKNFLFKMKVITKTNSNVLTLMVTFIYPALYMKYPFWANLPPKIKIKNFLFKMNLVPRLVRVLNSIVMFKFSLLYRKYPFLSNLVQKNQNYLFKLKFVFWIKFNMLNLTVMFNFLF